MFFRDKACIITGGARGIGKAITGELLKHGAKCLFVDILYKEGEATLVEFQKAFGRDQVLFMRVDVGSHTNFEMAFHKCLSNFGGLDILVNNAGINAETSWETQVQTNFMGTIRGCQLAIRYMGTDGSLQLSTRMGGLVLNISSVQGLLSWPAMPTYSAAKAGIIAYTRCAGHQVEFEAHGVKIMSLCPFGVVTLMQDFEVYTGMSEVGEKFLAQQDVKTNILSAEDVGKAAIQVLEDGTPASVWYLHKHGCAPYQVPDQNTMENLLSYAPETN